MKSEILAFVVKIISPLAVLLSLYLLYRGHHHPGGGFVAGLVLTSTAWLRAISANTLKRDAMQMLIGGLFLALGTCLIGPLVGHAPFTHFHFSHFSTTLVFDAGVLLAVVGSTLALVNVFREAGQ